VNTSENYVRITAVQGDDKCMSQGWMNVDDTPSGRPFRVTCVD
jgi:hypothetical protein